MFSSNFVFLREVCPEAAECLEKAEIYYALHNDKATSLDQFRKAINYLVENIINYSPIEAVYKEPVGSKVERLKASNYIPFDIAKLINEILKQRNLSYYNGKESNTDFIHYFYSVFNIAKWFCFTYKESRNLPDELIDPKDIYYSIKNNNDLKEHQNVKNACIEGYEISDKESLNLVKINRSLIANAPNKDDIEQRDARSLQITQELSHSTQICIKFFDDIEKTRSIEEIVIDVPSNEIKYVSEKNNFSKSSKLIITFLILLSVGLFIYILYNNQIVSNNYGRIINVKEIGLLNLTPEPFEVASMTPEPTVVSDITLVPTAVSDITPEPTVVPDITQGTTIISDITPEPTKAFNLAPEPNKGAIPTPMPKILSANLIIKNFEIYVGDATKVELTVKTEPNNSIMPKITFTSSSERIASVNESGDILGISPGKVTIYAEVLDHTYEKDLIVKDENKIVLETLITGPLGDSDGVLGRAKINTILDFVQTNSGDIYFLDTEFSYYKDNEKKIRRYNVKTNEIETIPIDQRFDFIAKNFKGEEIIYTHDKFNPRSLLYDNKNDKVYVYDAYAAYMINPKIEFIAFTPTGGGYFSNGLSGMAYDYSNDLLYLLDGGYYSAVNRVEDRGEATKLFCGDEYTKLLGWDIGGLFENKYLYICQRKDMDNVNDDVEIIKFNTFTSNYEIIYSKKGRSIGIYDDSHFIALIDDAFVKIDLEGNSEILFTVSSIDIKGENEIGENGMIHNIKRGTDNNILFSEGNSIRKINIKGN